MDSPLRWALARKALLSEGESGLTLEGEIVGTPAYMSPEQVRGEPVDFRTDIFSFGALLYRMIRGRDAFDRGSPVETMHAILTAEPGKLFSDGQPIPFPVESILRHCLQPAPEDRFQSARDLAFALEACAGPPDAIPAPSGAAARLRRRVAWLAAAACASGLTLLVAYLTFGVERPTPGLDGRLFAQVTDEAGAELFPSLSPDAKRVAYASKAAGNWDVYLRQAGSGESINLTKDSPEDDTQPAFSPSGTQIAFRSDRAGGGQPVRITHDAYVDWNPVWSPDGAFLYFCSNRGGRTSIWRMAMKESSGEARGAPEQVRTPASYTAHLSFSRDGRSLAYVQQLTTGLLYSVRLDPAGEAALSEPKEIFRSLKGAARPALSPDGKWLAFNSTEEQEDLFLVGVDGSGLRQLTSDGHRNRGPRWSPDGSQLAYTIFGVNTFLLDTGKSWKEQTPERLPPMPGVRHLFNGWAWSPDGRLLAGFLDRGEGIAVYSPASRTYRTLSMAGTDPVWMRDSRRLLYLDRGKIYVLDSETGRSHELVSIAPEEIARRGFSVNPDESRVYFSAGTTEADVWLLKFER